MRCRVFGVQGALSFGSFRVLGFRLSARPKSNRKYGLFREPEPQNKRE